MCISSVSHSLLVSPDGVVTCRTIVLYISDGAVTSNVEHPLSAIAVSLIPGAAGVFC